MERRRIPRVALRLGLVLLGGVVLPELVLRLLLFGELAPLARLAAPLQREELFTPPRSRASWALKARFERVEPQLLERLDPLLGHRSQAIEPGTYRHADEGELRGRRPILLYGDSYAQCVTRPEWCWQGLLEESDLGARFALLNYGVGGYGFDQACLLLEHTLELYRALDPLVIVCILVDDDLDRCALPVRELPKPHFELDRDGSLMLLPPPPTTPEGLVLAPLGIRSFLWNGLLCGSGLVSPARRDRWLGVDEERRTLIALSERLVERSTTFLRQRGVQFFFVLFHGRAAAEATTPYTWREASLYASFELHGVPFVSSKRHLWARARETGQELDAFYNPSTSKRGRNHYNQAGNRAAFAALRAGLQGEFEPYDSAWMARPADAGPSDAGPR